MFRMPERRQPFLKGNDIVCFDRKKIPITPETTRAFFDRFAADAFFDGIVVVDDFQRAKTELANMQRLSGILVLAFLAL